MTVLLLPTVLVMAWRCWNLPPIRIWSLSFAAMTVALLGQVWMCQYWKSKFVEFQEAQLQSLLQSRRQQQSLSKTTFCYRYGASPGGVLLASRPEVLRCAAKIEREESFRTYTHPEYGYTDSCNVVSGRAERVNQPCPAPFPPLFGRALWGQTPCGGQLIGSAGDLKYYNQPTPTPLQKV